MNHDLLTRFYFRHYAFLRRRYPHKSPSVIVVLTSIGVSGLASLAAFAVLAMAFGIASLVAGKPIAPWDAPNWLIFAQAVGLAWLPEWFIDRKMKPFREEAERMVEFYGSPEERFRWWLAWLSILPLLGVIAACFGALRLAQ